MEKYTRETEILQDQDVAAIMRLLEGALLYGETIAALLAYADMWEEDGELEVAANYRVAAAWRMRLYVAYGI